MIIILTSREMIAKRLFSAKAKQVLANAIRKTQAVE